jgi:hypothetical protein
MFIQRFNPGVCISATGVEALSDEYKRLSYGAAPAMMAVHPQYLESAYSVFAENLTLNRLPVFPLPGLSEEFWFVGGPCGIVWVEF